MKASVVKPHIWNFSVAGGKDSWKEVVYSARMSGVPPQISDEDVFRMMIENDYRSAVEHVIVKFDIKMSKGNAPEFLEHRIASHSGFSTRYIEVSSGIDKKELAYEVILPVHLMKADLKKALPIRTFQMPSIRRWSNIRPSSPRERRGRSHATPFPLRKP